MSKEVDINLDTPMDTLRSTIESFKNPDNIRYDEKSNYALLNICRNNADSSSKDIARDLRDLKKAIIINKAIKVIANEYKYLDEPYQSGYKVMSFEKDQFNRLKSQLKSSDASIKNGAYYYCIYLGLIKSHINTSGYIADKREKIASLNDPYSYIPSDRYELTTEEFQKTIIDALDDLEEEINTKRCK